MRKESKKKPALLKRIYKKSTFFYLTGLLIIIAAIPLTISVLQQQTNSKPLASQTCTLFGEYNPSWQSGNGVDNTVITQQEAAVGHQFNLIHWYAAASEGYASYDSIMVNAAISLGETPFVSWGIPVGFTNTADIDDWAKGMAATGKTIFVRMFWEFNDPPDTTNADWGVCQGPYTPAQLVTTWQFVVNRFRTDGATNVKFVWNPDGTVGSQMYGSECGSLATAYPGDDYVDYRGFDDYEYDTQTEYNDINSQTASSKPMLLGEIGTISDTTGPTWLNEMSTGISNGSLSEIAGVVWFNDDPSVLSSAPNSLAALKNMLSTPAFQCAAGSASPAVTASTTTQVPTILPTILAASITPTTSCLGSCPISNPSVTPLMTPEATITPSATTTTGDTNSLSSIFLEIITLLLNLLKAFFGLG